jgi:hypothetical protein
MLTENLERYKQLYSEYIELSIELHNYQQAFLATLGQVPREKVGSAWYRMGKLCKEMKKLARLVHRDHLANRIELKAIAEAEAAYRKANPKKPGPKGPWKHKK